MNKEIKINKASKSITFINNGIAFSQLGIADEILDLITNLQQENEELKKKLDRRYYKNEYERIKEENEKLKEQLEYLRSGEYLNQVKWERDLNENLNQTLGIELEDYKSRCEKAIEYIKQQNVYYGFCDNLLNILQNGSEKDE